MMKLIQPELDEIKNKYKTDKQAQAVATMKLYKDKGLKPFSSIFLLFIQLPIIFALYKIFYDTGFSVIHTELLYSWVPVPELVGTNFLGLIDVTKASIIMALLAAASQYFQIHISVPKIAPRKEGAALHEDFARNMQVQMKYIFPVMIFFISWNIASALAIYWTTSNLFMLGQELYIRRQLAKEKPLTTA
jgi:YidC/Oxa1 family membrane protein insertase